MFQHTSQSSSFVHKGFFSMACFNFLKVVLPIFPLSKTSGQNRKNHTYNRDFRIQEYIVHQNVTCTFRHLKSLPLLSDPQLGKWRARACRVDLSHRPQHLGPPAEGFLKATAQKSPVLLQEASRIPAPWKVR